MMMKNNAHDITSLLTEMMERISNEDLNDEKLAEEINRGKAIGDLSRNVLSIWNLQVRLAEAQDAALRPETFNSPAALRS